MDNSALLSFSYDLVELASEQGKTWSGYNYLTYAYKKDEQRKASRIPLMEQFGFLPSSPWRRPSSSTSHR